MQRAKNGFNSFTVGTFSDGFKSDSAASVAVKGLNQRDCARFMAPSFSNIRSSNRHFFFSFFPKIGIKSTRHLIAKSLTRSLPCMYAHLMPGSKMLNLKPF